MAIDSSTQVFCPVCRCYADQQEVAAFIEGGEWDEFKEEYEWEGDVSVYRCSNKKCKQEFFI